MQAAKTRKVRGDRGPDRAAAIGSRAIRRKERGRKEPVGKQRIASDQEIRRIDPVWLFGPVPNGFWNEPENRRSFLIWLSHRLGFGQVIDLYRLTYEAIAEHHGASVAGVWWHSSPVYAVKECFPDYDWQEWQFTQVPATFWRSARNRRRYISWLGRQLGFQRPADWYRITTEDFQNNRGGTLLLEYDSSVSTTVMACFPRYHWKEWMFSRRCMGFWDDPANCRRYMRWFGKRLGYRRLDDWYKVKYADFTENYGKPLVRRYRDSAAATVMAIVPRKRWHEWMFTRVPPGFWDDINNRTRYVKWLGRRLGYCRMADWAGVRRSNFYENCGGSLIGMYHSCWDLLAECFPDWDWKQYHSTIVKTSRYHRPNLTIKQILEWSDAYFAAHGQWPAATTGAIAEGGTTWQCVDAALRQGSLGLPGGSSLPRLLEEKRGKFVAKRKHYPALTEQQIIAWQKSYRKATGGWPQESSGPVAEAPEETWFAISRALRRGNRGLPGSSGLAKLRQQYGLDAH